MASPARGSRDMKLKNLKKGRTKAVSPIIAVLLLILIAVAAAVLIYAWVIGYAGQIRPTTPETSERLKIEAGKLFIWTTDVKDEDLGDDATDNPSRMDVNATLYIRNIGGTDVNITDVYLLTTGLEVINITRGYGPNLYYDRRWVYIDHVSAAHTLLEVGKVARVDICFPDTTVQKGRPYLVRVVTSLGNEYSIQLKATG